VSVKGITNVLLELKVVLVVVEGVVVVVAVVVWVWVAVAIVGDCGRVTGVCDAMTTAE
jgi:hypothetical protein